MGSVLFGIHVYCFADFNSILCHKSAEMDNSQSFNSQATDQHSDTAFSLLSGPQVGDGRKTKVSGVTLSLVDWHADHLPPKIQTWQNGSQTLAVYSVENNNLFDP